MTKRLSVFFFIVCFVKLNTEAESESKHLLVSNSAHTSFYYLSYAFSQKRLAEHMFKPALFTVMFVSAGSLPPLFGLVFVSMLVVQDIQLKLRLTYQNITPQHH